MTQHPFEIAAESQSTAALWRAWRGAAAEPVVDGAVRDLYARLDAAVQQRGPTCWISGRCCNFDAYGHRLYVTGLEIAWVMKEAQAQRHEGAELPGRDKERSGDVDLHGPCPFQVGRLCSIHSIRPLGCRVYFCQEGTQAWQHEVYERFLGDLRRLHEAHGLAYRYMEWRAGLHEAAAHVHV